MLAFTASAQAQTVSGTAHTIDGDSLKIGDTEVRLFGIDAPEYRQTCQVNFSAWACGADAAAALRQLVDNRALTCVARDRDVYGRTVASCMIDGQDVAASMVRPGYAVVLENGRADYAALESQARQRQAGIWASKFDIPSAYRATHPGGSAEASASSSRRWSAPVGTGTAQSLRYRFYTCAQARAAGAAPMYRGQANYNPNLDGDRDGIACEPYRGR
nr:thermonuclease family protein [Novosphingobium fluoreni]